MKIEHYYQFLKIMQHSIIVNKNDIAEEYKQAIIDYVYSLRNDINQLYRFKPELIKLIKKYKEENKC